MSTRGLLISHLLTCSKRPGRGGEVGISWDHHFTNECNGTKDSMPTSWAEGSLYNQYPLGTWQTEGDQVVQFLV